MGEKGEVRTCRPSAGLGGRSAGFTLVELLVVVAVIGVLMALLMPTLRNSVEMARRSSCLMNVRQQGIAFAQYLADHNDSYRPVNEVSVTVDNNESSMVWQGYGVAGLPPTRTNFGLLEPYAKDIGVQFCPSMMWSDSSWNYAAPAKSKFNFARTSGWNAAWGRYSISSYATTLFVVKAYVLRGGKTWRVGAWAPKLPLAMDAWDAPGVSGRATHDRQGCNVSYNNGSAKWWFYAMLDQTSFGERNTYSDGGGHTGCIRMWRGVSGMMIPY